MKKLFLAAVLVSIAALSSTSLLAWGGRSGSCCDPEYSKGEVFRGGFRGFHRLEYLKEEIGLSDEQIKEIISINSEYRYKYFINRDNDTKLDELREAHKMDIDNLLTDEQKKKIDDDSTKWARRHRYPRGRRY